MTDQNQDPITCFIADAQPLLSESLRMALAAFPGIKPLTEHPAYANVAIEQIRDLNPDVVVLDYWMPGVDGPELSCEVLAELRPHKVLFLSWFFANRPWFNAPNDIEDAIKAGAVGFLPKHCHVEDVAEAISRAHAGEVPVFSDFLEDLLWRMRRKRQSADEVWQQFARLTPREVEILQVLSDGTPTAQAAEKLYISQATLRTHVSRILQKTGTHSLVAAIALARGVGIIRE